jgi:hypothetical protein
MPEVIGSSRLNTGSTLSLLPEGVSSSIIRISGGHFIAQGLEVSQLYPRRVAFASAHLVNTGVAAYLNRVRTVTLSSGHYVATGKPSSLRVGRTVHSLRAVFFAIGGTAVFPSSRRAAIDSGRFTVLGSQISAKFSRIFNANRGSLVVTGKTIANISAIKLTASKGVFLISGRQFSVRASRAIIQSAGMAVLSGKMVSPIADKKLSTSAGSVVCAGRPISFISSGIFSALRGSFVCGGKTATLRTSRKSAISRGSFTETGRPIPLLAQRSAHVARGQFLSSGKTTLARMQRMLLPNSGNLTDYGKNLAVLASRRLPMVRGDLIFSGRVAGLILSRKIQFSSSRNIIAGHAATSRASRRISFGCGTVILSGKGEALAANRKVRLSAGNCILTGANVTQTISGKTSIGTGAFTAIGKTAFVIALRKLTIAKGAITASGGIISVVIHRTIPLERGAIVSSGRSINFGCALIASGGANIVTLKSSTINRGYKATFGRGSGIVGGKPISLVLSRRLAAAAGSGVASGRPATLTTAGGTWAPSSLTSLAVWFDPSDFSTMWQDSAKTTQVTAANQPIGYIEDKSGNAHHASQSTSGSRPTLRQDSSGRYYIDCSGSVYLDMYSTSASIINGIGVFDIAMAVGGRAATIWKPAWVVGISGGSTYEWVGTIDNATGAGQGGRRQTSDSWQQLKVTSIPASPSTLIHEFDYANATGNIWNDGVLVNTGAFQTSGSTPTYSSTLVSFCGSPNDGGYGGKIYSFVGAYGLTSSERSSLNTYLESKSKNNILHPACGSLILSGKDVAISRWAPSSLTSLAAWYDPSDFSTMWQDSAKTTQVTAADQYIGYISDKSGNGYHLSQSTSGSRPQLKQDGNGKYYIDITSSRNLKIGSNTLLTSKTFLFVGASYKATGNGMIWSAAHTGGSEITEFSYGDNGTGYELSGRRLSTDSFSTCAVGSTDTALRSIISTHDYTNASTSIYVNNSLVKGPTSSQTSGSTPATDSSGFAIGSWVGGGYGGTGTLYQFVLGWALSSDERVSLDAYLKGGCGI